VFSGPCYTLIMTHPQRRLLVVDDNPARRLSLSSLLSQAGYSVQAVAEVGLALTLTRAKPPDLVVAAAAVGLAACTAIRAEARSKDLPVVIVSDHDTAVDRAQALAVGADESVGMPLDRESFLDLLDQLLHIREVARQLDVGAAPLVAGMRGEGPDE
jgi:two-component system cell cycle response regulator